METAWRFCEFEMTRRIPSVERYPVHLENENYILIQNSRNCKQLETQSVSKLERYFGRPSDPTFENVRYLEYYSSYDVKQPMKGTFWKDNIKFPQPNYVHKRTKLHIARIARKSPKPKSRRDLVFATVATKNTGTIISVKKINFT